jgi:hypothetical protein
MAAIGSESGAKNRFLSARDNTWPGYRMKQFDTNEQERPWN